MINHTVSKRDREIIRVKLMASNRETQIMARMYSLLLFLCNCVVSWFGSRAIPKIENFEA
jgi:hypothetical protein